MTWQVVILLDAYHLKDFFLLKLCVLRKNDDYIRAKQLETCEYEVESLVELRFLISVDILKVVKKLSGASFVFFKVHVNYGLHLFYVWCVNKEEIFLHWWGKFSLGDIQWKLYAIVLWMLFHHHMGIFANRYQDYILRSDFYTMICLKKMVCF